MNTRALIVEGNRWGKSDITWLMFEALMADADMTDPTLLRPCVPPSLRLTAHERRNPNQPFYRGIHQKRKR